MPAAGGSQSPLHRLVSPAAGGSCPPPSSHRAPPLDRGFLKMQKEGKGKGKQVESPPPPLQRRRLPFPPAGRRRLTAPSSSPPRARRRPTFPGAPSSRRAPPSASLHLLSDEEEMKRKEELRLLFGGKGMALVYEGVYQFGKVLRVEKRSVTQLMNLLNEEEKVEAATKGLVVQAYGCRKSKIHSVTISIRDQFLVFGGEGWNDLMYVNDAEERMHLDIFCGKEDSHLKLGVFRFRST